MARSLLLVLSFALIAAAAACGGGGDPDACDVEPGTYVVDADGFGVLVEVDEDAVAEIVGNADTCTPVLTGSACGGVVSCRFGGSDPVTITITLALDEGLADACSSSSASESCTGFRPVTRGL